MIALNCRHGSQKRIPTVGQDEIQVRSLVSLDPGVRTFVTACSANHAASHGDGFRADKVFRSCSSSTVRPAQGTGDWKRHFRERIGRLAVRIRIQVDDLHRRFACDLGRAFDVILHPSLETRDMSAREGRRIRTRTVR